MVIEAARGLAGLAGANSTEFEPDTPHPVISTMADQRDVIAGERDMGGTMRLGAYPAKLRPGSIVERAYGTTEVCERHRHRYEVNNDYRGRLEEAGLVFSGTSPDGRLVEYVELPADVHPFYAGTQAHPEFTSRPTRPQPLFRAFVQAALDHAAAERLPVELPEHDGGAVRPSPLPPEDRAVDQEMTDAELERSEAAARDAWTPEPVPAADRVPTPAGAPR
jgi:CTP synthase